MSTSDRLGELRTSLLPHVIRHLAESGSKYQNAAELNQAAAQRFDARLTETKVFFAGHTHEDPDVLTGHFMHLFEEIGIPHLASLPIIEEFVLPPKQKPAAD